MQKIRVEVMVSSVIHDSTKGSFSAYGLSSGM